MRLIPHDGATEAFACRDCMVEIDPVGGHYPRWTDQEAEDGVCPHCGGTDTRYMFRRKVTTTAPPAATIEGLAAEFARLDADGAEGYVAHEQGGEQDWPTVGFRAGGDGHAVVSVHPDDVGAAVAVMRRYEDGAANVTGPESWAYDPRRAMKVAGVRCEWHV